MVINEINFKGSFASESQCPSENMPEYAFIGRSNVGKSSLINALTGRKDLARVSKQPGKTQLINFFEVNGSWNLVDLPGYGYAKISKKKRLEWEKMIQRYLALRGQLVCSFVLIDLRHPLQSIDLEFINWLGESHIPFSIIYTKSDKLSRAKIDSHVARIENELLKYWNELPRRFVTSSEKQHGLEEVLLYIDEMNVMHTNV